MTATVVTLSDRRDPSTPVHAPGRHKTDKLHALARSLSAEGRAADAAVLFDHIAAIDPGNAEAHRQLARILGSQGRTFEAIKHLLSFKTACKDADVLIAEIVAQMPAAIERFNALIAEGSVAEAEKYAAALADLVPGNPAILNSALSCNVALQRWDEAKMYATALLKLDPTHAVARTLVGRAPDAARADAPVAAAPAADPGVHPLVRLRDMHDAMSHILCGPLTDEGAAQIKDLRNAARHLKVDMPAGTEWAGWEKHYRLAIKAIDLEAALAPTPRAGGESKLDLAAASGKALNWSAVQAKAKRAGAKVAFFVAADRNYVDQYARWYVKSVLKHCDVPCLVFVHVIGGAGTLADVAKSLGVQDDRVVLCGDDFDAAAVRTKCYDTPPKGLIAKPVAHFQSVRFQRLGTLLEKLRLPVFVSDIDLLLQGGVKELLHRFDGDDLVLNENASSPHAGSRFTANLILAHPTGNTQVFFRFLREYLDRALGDAEVSRWIDQFGLMMAQHHLVKHAAGARIGRFDTAKDINNVMYKSYQENPFTFLSLYHGFDTSTLEDKAAHVMGDGDAPVAKPKSKAGKKQRKKAAAR